MTCTIVAAVVTCVAGLADAPKPSPADALKIFVAASVPLAPVPVAPTGPVYASTGASGPTVGVWAWPTPAPARRLDGSLVSDPVTVYGLGPWRVHSRP